MHRVALDSYAGDGIELTLATVMNRDPVDCEPVPDFEKGKTLMLLNIVDEQRSMAFRTKGSLGINFVEFSVDCNAETRFSFGRGDAMALTVAEGPKLLSLAHDEACHLGQPIVLVFGTFDLIVFRTSGG